MTTTLPAQAPEIEKKAGVLLEKAYDFVIQTGPEYESAGEFLKTIKKLQKEIDSTFDPIVSSAHSTWKEALSAKKKHSEPLALAEKVVKEKAGDYLATEEKRRQEEEARLRVEAEKKAKEEQLARAVEAEDMGATEEDVQEVLQEHIPIAPIVVQKSVPKVQGISQRSSWKFRVTNKKALPEEYKMANEKTIGAVVRSQEGETRIPGIEIWEEKGLAVRA